MKKSIVSILILSCSFFSSCALLQLPGLIIQELVPMFMQYAPYALMFIEETNEKVIVQHNSENFSRDLSNIQKSPHELNELSYTIRKKLAQTNTKYKSIYILNLKDLSKKQILDMYKSVSKQGKIHYQFVKITDHNSCKKSINDLNSEITIPINVASMNLEK